MTVLDAYAVIAAMRDEPARPRVEELLRDRSDPACISAANLAEVHDQLIRIGARSPGDVDAAVELLRLGGLEVVPVDAVIGRRAGRWRAQHYHRERCAVSLADCLAAATAAARQEALATSDPHLSSMARAAGIDLIPLADSQGRQPRPS